MISLLMKNRNSQVSKQWLFFLLKLKLPEYCWGILADELAKYIISWKFYENNVL